MYIIMHGYKNGLLYSTENSVGIKPEKLLKQLIKKFPKEKIFYICCCYSNYVFPKGDIEYHGIKLIPMIKTNNAVEHYIVNPTTWEKQKTISKIWNVPFPKEKKDIHKIDIKEWCQKQHIKFKNICCLEKYGSFLFKANREEIAYKLKIDPYNDEVYDDFDFLIYMFQKIFPEYKLETYMIGKTIYPHFLYKDEDV